MSVMTQDERDMFDTYHRHLLLKERADAIAPVLKDPPSSIVHYVQLCVPIGELWVKGFIYNPNYVRNDRPATSSWGCKDCAALRETRFCDGSIAHHPNALQPCEKHHIKSLEDMHGDQPKEPFIFVTSRDHQGMVADLCYSVDADFFDSAGEVRMSTAFRNIIQRHFGKLVKYQHIPKCLYGAAPQAIVQESADIGTTSKLATNLYFRRCNSEYSNLVGGNIHGDAAFEWKLIKGKDEESIARRSWHIRQSEASDLRRQAHAEWSSAILQYRGRFGENRLTYVESLESSEEKSRGE